MRGCERHRDGADALRIPPVHAGGSGDALAAHPVVHAERHEKARRTARLRGQREDGRAVEVVVMVVRDQHDVDVRQVAKRDGQRDAPLWPCERHRRCARRELRIGQHVEARDLDQQRRMPEPGDGRVGAIRAQVREVRRRGGQAGIATGRAAASRRCAGARIASAGSRAATAARRGTGCESRSACGAASPGRSAGSPCCSRHSASITHVAAAAARARSAPVTRRRRGRRSRTAGAARRTR